MEEKIKFRAKIAGKEYTIVGNRSTEHMNQVVAVANQHIQTLGELAPHLSLADRGMLVAINAISDQIVLEQRIAKLEQQILQLQQENRPTGATEEQIAKVDKGVKTDRYTVPTSRVKKKQERSE